MEYQTLYRKYRPKNFKSVVGQEHVTDVLEHSLKEGAVSHAYLFFGSRGTGKTTVARILADRLGVASVDIHEMDAASNRKIEDIRELREAVHVQPFESKYKIYILDEVHMLTNEAFNALLKTLEEPPHYVIFILATTELHKVPDTIISRCQVFTFKNPTKHILKDHVLDVSKREGKDIEPDAAELVAFMGNGSFRDTQSILQKVLTFSDAKKLSYEDVARVVGAPPKKLVQDFVRALVDEDKESLFLLIQKASEHTLNMVLFIDLLITSLRKALLFRYAPDMKQDLQKELGEDLDFYKEVLQERKGIITSKTLDLFLEARERQELAHIQTLPLELAVVKLFESMEIA